MFLKDCLHDVDMVVKRDDIRGVWGANITADFARALGRALAEFFQRTTAVRPVNVVVGHDMRLSGPVLAAALCEGLEAGGCRAIQMGRAGTELVGFLAAKYSDVIDGGVMITASHNPPDNTGFKFFGRSGYPLPTAVSSTPPLPEDEMQRLALGIKKQRVPDRLNWDDFAPDYIMTALEKGGCDFERAAAGASRPLRVAVEAGNGMGGKIMREFARLAPQFEWVFSNENPDGSFPIIVPNPINHEYQAMVSRLVTDTGSDVGVCFDGDADRVAIVDENGDMVSAPLLAAVLGGILRERLGPHEKIAHNIACSWVVADALGDRDKVVGDGPTVITTAGYSKIKAIMNRDPRIALGAEHSGHYMFREFWCADSGMLAGLIMLELSAELHSKGRRLSQELKPLREPYFESGEINFQLPPGHSVASVAELAVKQFGDEAVRMFVVGKEGCVRVDSYPPQGIELASPDVRLEAENWWFCMRRSGTEGAEGDILRLYVESCGDRELMEQKRDQLVELAGPELRL